MSGKDTFAKNAGRNDGAEKERTAGPEISGQVDPSIAASSSSGIAGLAAFAPVIEEAGQDVSAETIANEDATGIQPSREAFGSASDPVAQGSVQETNSVEPVESAEPFSGGEAQTDTAASQGTASTHLAAGTTPGPSLANQPEVSGDADAGPTQASQALGPRPATGGTETPTGETTDDSTDRPVDDDGGETPTYDTWEPSARLSSTVSEDLASESSVIELAATDQYGEPLTYVLTDAEGEPLDDSRFIIDGSVVRLAPGVSLDFEAGSETSLYVTATNEGGTSGPWEIDLTIEDVAEDVVLDDGGVSFVDESITERSITGGSGADTIVGGNDGARLGGGDGADSLVGGEGADTLSSGAGDDIALGGAGHDDIAGDSGDDTLVGGSGHDTLRGDAGDDHISGGEGSDTAVWQGNISDFAISYDQASDTFTITDLAVADGDEGRDTISGVELFEFGGVQYTREELVEEADRQANTAPGEATLESGGSVAENSVAGTVVASLTATDADGDTLSFTLTDADGNPIDDTNFEIVGDQVLVKDGASLDFESADAHEIYVVVSDDYETSSPQRISIAVSDEAERIKLGDDGEAFADTSVTETFVTGGNGADTITGTSGDDGIDGWSGSDQLTGGAGNDGVYGGGGDDTVDGGTGDDTLSGWSGDDNIDGGDGTDVLTYRGSLEDFAVVYDADSDSFVIIDLNSSDGLDEGQDTVTGVETFVFGTTTVTKEDLIVEADRQANTAPTDPVIATGGSVAENSGTGTIVATLSATDVDADTLTFTLTDENGNPVDDANFEIVGNEIRVKDGATINFEDASQHEIFVVAADDHETSAPERLLLTVVDEAEFIRLGDGGIGFVDEGVSESEVRGGSGSDTITAGDGGSHFTGGQGDDLLVGGAGGDLLEGWNDNDRLFGGDGADTLFGGHGNDSIVGGSGDDQIAGGVGNDTSFGGDGDDGFSVNRGDDLIDGGSGDDIVSWNGDISEYSIAYDQSTSTFVITDNDTSFLGDGSDTVTGVERFNFAGVTYTEAEMIVEADRQANTAPTDPAFEGGGSVAENSATGTLVATLTATDVDSDSLTFSITDADGNPIDDTNFEIVGNEIRVKDGALLNYENTSTPQIYVVATDDYESSAPQPLTIVVTDEAEVIQLENGGQVFSDSGVAEVSITGGLGADTISAHDDGAVIDGNDGDDSITGGAGSDSLSGGAGNDTIFFGDGSDTVFGGDGDDYIDDAPGNPSTSGGDYVDAGDGNDQVWSGDGDDTLIGGSGNDYINGQFGSDSIDGGGGRDTLFGEAGDDTILGRGSDDEAHGGEGNDFLDGDWGHDRLFGDAGNDTILGGDGLDSVEGGSGSDSIAGGSHSDTLIGGEGNDTLDGGANVGLNPIIRLDFSADEKSTAYDGSGNGFHGEYKGGAVPGATGWNGAGSAVTLDGADDYIEIADDAAFDLPEGTVSIRFNADNISGTQALVSRDSSSFDGGGHFRLVLNGDGSIGLRMQDQSTSYTLTTDAGLVNAGNWHHVSVTFGAEGVRLYVDGSLQELNSYNGGIAGNDEPWTLGADQWQSGDGTANNLKHYFDGALDEFLVYDTQFDDAEVATLATDGASAFGDTDVAVYSGALSDFAIVYDAATQTFTITDQNTGDGDEGVDSVTGVEEFVFGGVTYTLADLLREADRQANTAPTDPAVASGGSVAENSSSGTVVARLSAADVDGDRLTFAITDADGNPVDDTNFEIVGDEIRVKDGANLDYETNETHELNIVVSDDHDTSAPERITVTVSDVAENILLADGGQVFNDAGVAETSITGGTGNDTIVGNEDGANIDGAGGDDSLTGGAGDDTISGGDGNDTIFFGDGSNTIFGGAGDDYIDDASGNPATTGGDYIDAGEGADQVWSGDADDTILGGGGNDSINGQSGNDDVDGGSGNDQIFGESGDDTLRGSGGFDSIVGGFGNDSLEGGSGNDTFSFEGGFGIDTVDAGFGWDLLDFSTVDGAVNVEFTADETGTATLGEASVTFGDIERIATGSGNDTIIADVMLDGTYSMGAGNDSISAGSTGDSISLGSGDDTVTGNGGADTIDGGEGTDTAVYSGASSDYDISFDSVSGQLTVADLRDGSPDGTDILTSVEQLNFSDGTYEVATRSSASSMIDSSSARQIYVGSNDYDYVAFHNSDAGVTVDLSDNLAESGGHAEGDVFAGGIEQIDGSQHDDTIVGGMDVVQLKGWDGNDSIVGSSNDDLIYGNEGDDTIAGGGGSDIAAYDGTVDDFEIIYNSMTGTFTITDRNVADGVNEGTDQVSGVEQFSFAGMRYTAEQIASRAADINDAPDNPDTTTSQSDATFEGGSGSGSIRFGDGEDATDDVAYGFGGDDTMGGGGGNDKLDGGAGNDDLYGEAGNDTLYGGSGNDYIDGGTEADQIYGDSGADTIDGWSGDDTVRGGSGDDSIMGYTGNDALYGDAGNDQVFGEDGHDTLYGGSGADTLSGGSGDDDFYGGLGNDNLDGGDGNDRFYFSALEGNDKLDGGTGWTDVIVLNGMGDQVKVDGGTVYGEGWTMVLDGDSSVKGQTLDSLELSPDAVGTITFDDGGAVDFAGIERVEY